MIDVLGRTQGHETARLREIFAPLVGEAIELIEVGDDAAWRAAELRGRHYERKASPLSLADCFALAAGLEDGALATADPALAKAARAEGIELSALPDSKGERP